MYLFGTMSNTKTLEATPKARQSRVKGNKTQRIMVTLGSEEHRFVREMSFAQDRWHSEFIRRLVVTHPDFERWKKEGAFV